MKQVQDILGDRFRGWWENSRMRWDSDGVHRASIIKAGVTHSLFPAELVQIGNDPCTPDYKRHLRICKNSGRSAYPGRRDRQHTTFVGAH